jgi:hypothetical protein
MRSELTLLCIGVAALFATPAFAASGQAMPNHKMTQAVSYVAIKPIYATVLDAGRPVGLLLVSFGLDIPNAALRARAEAALPLLRDAYVRNIMAFSAAAVRPFQQPDVNFIARRLQEVTDQKLQQSGARVLLIEVMLQMSR